MTVRPLELELTESGPAITRRLSGGQVSLLAAAGDLVTLTPASGGTWLVGGNRKIGAVALGQGSDAIRLRIRPKLPVERVLFLIGFAKDPDIWDAAVLEADRHRDLETVIARLYARTAGRGIDQGVLQGYEPIANEDTIVRGRIECAAQIRRHGLPIPVSVVYDDLTVDIAENRILLAAARRCASFAGLDRQTHTLLRRLESKLFGVRSLPPGSPRPAWSRSRLNARYHDALRLAELILDATTPDPLRGGEAAASGFVIDMATVFEDFLTETFEAALHRYGHRSAAQESRHRLDLASRVTLRPDITVYRKDQTVSVIDAKYKELGKNGRPSNEDLYQLTAYCTALGIAHGHLVYASGAPATTRHAIRQTQITITAHALNLAAATPEIIAQIDGIAREVAEAYSVDGAA